MSQPNEHPLEALLAVIARAEPEPWYHRLEGPRLGVDPDVLLDMLELLWLEGLIQKAPGTPETGPGVQLTPLGRQVLEDPAVRERLRRGEPLTRDPGAVVRNSLRRPVTPVVTRLLVGANVLVFVWGAFLASQRPGLLGTYLTGFGGGGRYLALLLDLGAAVSSLVMQGQWWRLVTTTLLHGGLLHLLMNMYTLNACGRFVEQTFGGWRLFLIYALGGWAGSCVAMGYTTGVPCIGASGAICGVLGAEGAWVLLYGRYLPRSLAQRGKSQLVTTVLLMVFISLLPGVSGWAHLGGALGGLAAALVLHFQRFGPAALRWLALVAFVPLFWGSYAWMQRSWAQTREGRAAAREGFSDRFGRPANQAANRVLSLCERDVEQLREQHPRRRDPDKVQAAIDALEKAKGEAGDLAGAIRKQSFREEKVAAAKEKALELLEACVRLCDEAVAYLKKGDGARKADERALRDRFDKVDDLKHEFRQLLAELPKEPAKR
jgi:rhomboid protease GluP